MGPRPISLCVLLCVPCSLLAAEAADPATRLDAISVVGRGESRQVQRVSAIEAQRLAPGSSPLRLLQYRPGVNLQSADAFGAYEWSTRISIRGFAQNQLGFMLDGVPLGDMGYANHSGLHISRAVIAENLDGIELAQGSGALDASAAHALGGAIQVQTAAPDFERGLRLAQSVGSDATRRSFARIDSGALGDLRFYLSAVDQDADKWKGWGPQRQRQFNGKLLWSLGDLELSAYAASSRRRETDYADLSLDSQRRLGFDWDNYARDWQRAIDAAGGVFTGGVQSLDDAYYLGRGLRDDDLGYLALDWADGGAFSARLLGYYHRNEGQGHWITPYAASPDVPLALRTTEYDIERSGLLPQFELELDRHRIGWGGWYEDNVHGLQRNLYALQRSQPPDAARYYRDPDLRIFRQRFDIRTAQFYLRDRWQLLPDRLLLDYGFKGADVRMRTRSLIGNRAAGELRTRDRFQPQASLRWTLDAQHEAFLSWNENTAAFRPGVEGPFSASQAAFDDFAPRLQPERSRTLEAGWRYQRDRLETSAAVYAVRFNNRLLGIAQCSGIVGCPYGFANVGAVETRGAELALRLRAGERIDWYNSLSWNDSRYADAYLDGDNLIPTDGKQVVDSPRLLASSRVAWQHGHWDGGLGAKYTSRRYITYSNDSQVPGYVVADFDLGYDASHWFDAIALRFRLQVSNLFDRRYFATVGSNGFVAFDPQGQNYTLLAGAPRQWFLTADLRF